MSYTQYKLSAAILLGIVRILLNFNDNVEHFDTVDWT